ncbi:MAG: hypothetical protein JWN01_917 [Patescibacteria group bacterium]|nr:hypothetical protein [Patescibacteria group bacterium]
MAKKKHTTKKHKFKHAEPDAGAMVAQPTVGAVTNGGARLAKQAAAADVRDFSYVFGDLRRIAVLGISLIALELVLWYLLNHTGLGDSVYHLIKV